MNIDNANTEETEVATITPATVKAKVSAKSNVIQILEMIIGHNNLVMAALWLVLICPY